MGHPAEDFKHSRHVDTGQHDVRKEAAGNTVELKNVNSKEWCPTFWLSCYTPQLEERRNTRVNLSNFFKILNYDEICDDVQV